MHLKVVDAENNPPPPKVAEMVARADADDMLLLYNIPAYSQGDVDAFLMRVARSKNYLKKVRV